MKLTRQMIESGRSDNGGYSKAQLSLLGIVWPPQHGWPKMLEGTEIDEQAYRAFMDLKNKHKQHKPRAVQPPSRRDYAHERWDSSPEAYANELYEACGRDLS